MTTAVVKETRADHVANTVIDIVAVLIIVVILYPLIFVLSASFSDPDYVLNGELILLPKGFTLEPYRMVFTNGEIWGGYAVSILVTAVGTLISVFLTILAAYPLSRKEMPFRNFFTFLIVFTMYFNGGLIPTYLLVRDLGMYNTLWALIIPSAIGTYNVIIARTFFQTTIPHELYESAMLDGCSNLRMLGSIVLPLSKAIVAVLILFYCVGLWNAYFPALIYLSNEKLYPLQLILRNILLLNQTEQFGANDVGMGDKLKMSEAIQYSVIVVSSVPMLLIYPFIQKYFVKGVMIGAIKG